MTHENVGGGFDKAMGPDGGPTTTTLEDNQVWHDGQIIGIVVAETYEAAREAANKSKVSYEEDTPSATFESPGVTTEPHKTEKGPDPKKGNAESAYTKRTRQDRCPVLHTGSTPQSDRALYRHL